MYISLIVEKLSCVRPHLLCDLPVALFRKREDDIRYSVARQVVSIQSTFTSKVPEIDLSRQFSRRNLQQLK